MTIFNWPSVLSPADVAFNPRNMTVSGPPTLSGKDFTAVNDAGRWIATLPQVAATTPEKVRAFRALRAKLQGGAHQLRVPAFDDAQAPWPNAGEAAGNAYASQPYSDDTFHTDGHGFYRPAIIVALAAAVALRDTLVYATITTAGTIEAGHYFSIRDRLYVIDEVVDEGVFAIWPPIRDPAPIGRRLNFEKLLCRMRLASEADMDLTLTIGRYGFSDINLVEAP